MNIDAMLSTLIQIPFLAAFIWFSLKLQNEFRADSKDREKHWMEFLGHEREQRREAMDNGMEQVKMLTESMRSITEALASLTKEMVDHSSGSEERHDTIIRSLDALHRRLDQAGICKLDNVNQQINPK